MPDAALGEDLERFESNDRGTPEFRARWIAEANAYRAARGIPPLKGEDEDPPEEEFYRKARARGMVRSPRRDP